MSLHSFRELADVPLPPSIQRRKVLKEQTLTTELGTALYCHVLERFDKLFVLDQVFADKNGGSSVGDHMLHDRIDVREDFLFFRYLAYNFVSCFFQLNRVLASCCSSLKGKVVSLPAERPAVYTVSYCYANVLGQFDEVLCYPHPYRRCRAAS